MYPIKALPPAKPESGSSECSFQPGLALGLVLKALYSIVVKLLLSLEETTPPVIADHLGLPSGRILLSPFGKNPAMFDVSLIVHHLMQPSTPATWLLGYKSPAVFTVFRVEPDLSPLLPWS